MGDVLSRENDVTEDFWRPRPSTSERRPFIPPSDERLDTEDVLRGEGSRVYVYKQDPAVKAIGYQQMWLLDRLRPGPSTKCMVTKGMPSDYGPTDWENNYLYNPNINEEAFDAVHTLSVVNHVQWMYRRALKRVKSKRDMNWLFDGPIEVYPLAGEQRNAYYSRNERALKFFFFDNNKGQRIKVCRSWDTVAHETGHAILDSLQPHWISGIYPECGALHESFGDITAILSILDQMDMCEAIVTHSKGNLRKRENMLAVIAEQFGESTGKPFGIRNAAEDLTISRASAEFHDLSRVFTGAVYDILVKLFEESIDIELHQPAEALYFAARHILSLFLVAVLEAPKRNPRFRDVARIMIRKEPEAKFKSVIKYEFSRREVFDERAKPRMMSMDETDGPATNGGEVQCTTVTYLKKKLSQDPGENETESQCMTNGPSEESDGSPLGAALFPAAVLMIASLFVIGLAIYWRF